MVEKQNHDNEIPLQPDIQPEHPGSDTAYRDPSLVGKLGYDSRTGAYGIVRSPNNGQTWILTDTVWGHVFSSDDIDNIWENGTSKKVKEEVGSATAEIPTAISQANDAVKRADEAVEKSTVASNAAASMSDAISEAKSDAQNATNIANAMKSSVTDQLKNLDSTSKELDNARSEMAQYAKTAQGQGKDIAELKKSTAEITADVANTKGDVAELKVNASATAIMASNNKSEIAQLRVTASNASVDLQNAKSDIASFNATASQINTSIKDQDNRISTVEQTANGIQTTVSDQQKDINSIKQDATGMKQTITNNQKQLTEINTNVDGLSTKVAGAVGKDFVESSIKQANDKINESITSINGNIQNITADINGVRATVKNKADESSVTQLSDVLQAQVTGKSAMANFDETSTDANLYKFDTNSILVTFNGGYTPKSGDTLTLTFDYSADVETDFTVGFDNGPKDFWGKNVYHLTKDPQHFSKTVTITDDDLKAINNAIKANNLIYVKAFFKAIESEGKAHFANIDMRIGGLQSKLSMLKDSIDLEVKNDDLLSRINLQAGQEIFQSKKIYLDADSVVFGKDSKAFIPDAAIEKLSLDKLTAGHLKIPIADEYGNQIEMGNDGIDVTSAPEDVKWSSIDDSGDKSQFKFNVTAKGVELTNHIIYGNPIDDKKSDDYRFLDLRPDILHDKRGSSDQVTTPNGMTLYIPTDYSSSLGPSSPGGFFAIGHETTQSQQGVTDRGIDIAYVTKPTNGWKKGLVVDTTMYMKAPGSSNHMRTAWVSWSNWDNGEHYPAIVSDGKWWGGVAFPTSGKVTLFDPYGHASWLTSGGQAYSAWGPDYDG